MIPFLIMRIFCITLRSDDLQDFDAKWYDILLFLTKIPLDDVQESLHKLRRRESDQLKNRIRIV